ncbi:hypothetical protein ABOM_005768, partial [Aspergillus bombycis]
MPKWGIPLLSAVGLTKGAVVGQAEQSAEIIEVRGPGGAPPYVVSAQYIVFNISVRFADGHTTLVFPGPDAIIQHREQGEE